jgi:hypothetical protein
MSEEIRIEPTPSSTTGDEVPLPATANGEGSLGTLVRQLAEDSRILIRQEVALAKTEIQDSVRTIAKGAIAIGLGIGMLLVGLLVLTAFLVLGLGRLLGGEYWLSSLIVGGALALLGAIALLAGKRGLAKGEIKPEHTVETMRENRDWARSEARQIKRDLTS